MENLPGEIVDFAKANGVGYWQLILGLAVLLLVWKAPELVKEFSVFFNERKRINDQIARRQASTLNKLRGKGGQVARPIKGRAP